jgi:hypothetical protein
MASGPLQHIGALPQTAVGDASKALIKFALNKSVAPAFGSCLGGGGTVGGGSGGGTVGGGTGGGTVGGGTGGGTGGGSGGTGGGNGGPQGNNGFGNGEDAAPGNSLNNQPKFEDPNTGNSPSNSPSSADGDR